MERVSDIQCAEEFVVIERQERQERQERNNALFGVQERSKNPIWGKTDNDA